MKKTAGNTQFMHRPRIAGMMERVTQSKLVFVVAGAGYGKTQAVRDYIERQEDAVVRWMQLTESDNIGARYWEHLTHNVSFDNPELAERLREFGFPETLTRFKQFAEILRVTEHRAHKTFLVLDDFHVIDSRQALMFAERCAHLNIPGACVIIISRTEPEINAVSLFAKGQADRLTEEDLHFTEKEISGYLDIRGISYSPADIAGISDATKGWALAVSLLAMVLEKTPGNIQIALGTVKQNIFKVMETEAWQDFPDETKEAMVRFSLISELPGKILQDNFSGLEFMRNTQALAPFIWYDSFTGQDRVHPLYLEFLRSKQDILTEEDKTDTYISAADCCFNNKLILDAIKYLAVSRQYGRILGILLSYPHILPPETCDYYLDILENLDDGKTEAEILSRLLLIYIFTPLLLAGKAEFEEAARWCYDAVSEREKSDDTISLLLLGITYKNLAYLDMYICTVSHKYNAPVYLDAASKYLKRYVKVSGVLPSEAAGNFSVADIRSFACLVGEGAGIHEFDEFREMAKQTAAHITASEQNMYYGYDDLVACEISFYRNKPKEAKRYAFDAIIKARERRQHSIEAMAAMYLFRIAMLEGNYPLVQELFRDKDNHSGSPYFWNRKFLYELGVGLLYAQIGLPKMVPAWLVTDDKERAFEISAPVRELICSAKYYISVKKYDRALTSLCSAYPRAPHDRFIFGELTLSLLTAAARLRTGDVKSAVRDFEKAYEYSFDGEFEIPFIELGRDFRLLADAVSKNGSGKVPEKWMTVIKRKASIYVKKTTVILNSFKVEHKVADAVELSQREHEVLTDLYHGLSREEISTSRSLSINTVHKVIQSIYLKLDAYGKADAIRSAIDKQLLD